MVNVAFLLSWSPYIILRGIRLYGTLVFTIDINTGELIVHALLFLNSSLTPLYYGLTSGYLFVCFINGYLHGSLQ